MSQYRTGRTTHKGVEVCFYFNENSHDEEINVIAHAPSHVLASVICQVFNRHYSDNKNGENHVQEFKSINFDVLDHMG